MIGAVRALLADLVDYAGLFPPAELPMADAVRSYAVYQRSEERWMLARFVAPASRLAQLAAAVSELPAELRGARPWEVTVLVGADAAADIAEALAVAAAQNRILAVRAFEGRAGSAERIAELRGLVPPRSELYCELPLADDLPALVAKARSVEARVKIRTGGITAEEFPSTEGVTTFLDACVTQRVAFKATAGLHHAVRGTAPLTYEKGSASATMFGHLNVLLAAAALWSGRPLQEARRLLEMSDRTALDFGGDGIRFGDSWFPVAELAVARRDFVIAVGSCSFSEPVTELRNLGANLDAAAAEGR